jgi:hypothetical protein
MKARLPLHRRANCTPLRARASLPGGSGDAIAGYRLLLARFLLRTGLASAVTVPGLFADRHARSFARSPGRRRGGTGGSAAHPKKLAKGLGGLVEGLTPAL